MSRFTDNLWSDLMRDHGSTLEHTERPTDRGRVSRTLQRPRVLAGSTLGLAGIGAGLVLALSAGGAAAPTQAFAITRHSDGSVFVQLDRQEDLGQANAKLAAMGIDEQITLYPNAHPTAYTGVENCTAASGAGAPNPRIELRVITNDADNTGVTGAVTCVVGPATSTSGGATTTGNS